MLLQSSLCQNATGPHCVRSSYHYTDGLFLIFVPHPSLSGLHQKEEKTRGAAEDTPVGHFSPTVIQDGRGKEAIERHHAPRHIVLNLKVLSTGYQYLVNGYQIMSAEKATGSFRRLFILTKPITKT